MANGNNNNNTINQRAKTVAEAKTIVEAKTVIKKMELVSEVLKAQLDRVSLAEKKLEDLEKGSLEYNKQKLKFLQDQYEMNQRVLILIERGQYFADTSEEKQKEKLERLKEELDKQEELLEIAEERLEVEKDLANEAKKISDNFGTLLFDTLTMKSYSRSIFKNFIDIRKKGLDWNQVTEQVNENMKKIDMRTVALEIGFKAVFAVVGLVKAATMDMVKALDEAGSSIVKLSGTTQGREMVSRLYGTADQMTTFGLTIRETAKAQGELFQNFRKYSELDKKTQTQLAMTGALFEAAGGSAKEFAVSMNLLNNAMGLTVKESVSITKSLVAFGRQLKMDQKTIQTGFNQAMKELAGFGLEGVQMFKELQVTAKKAGVEVSVLTKVFGDAMDTFEGSSRVAATLNTILGAQFIDSNRLLFGTRQERIMEVLRGFERSGKDFRSMSFFMKKEITRQLGFANIQEAQKILGKTSAEYAKSLEDMKKAKEVQKPLEDLAKTAATLSKKFTALKTQFAFIAEGFLKFATLIVDGLLWMGNTLGGWGRVISGVIIIYGTYKIAAFAFAGFTKLMAGSLGLLGPALAKVGLGMGTFLRAIAGGGKGVLILGGIALAIAAIAGSFAAFKSSQAAFLNAQANMANAVGKLKDFKADPVIGEFDKFFAVFTDSKMKGFLKFANVLSQVSSNMKELSATSLSGGVQSTTGSAASNIVKNVSTNQKRVMVLKTNTVKLATNDNTPIFKLGAVNVTLTGDTLMDSKRFKEALEEAIRNMRSRQ